MEIVLRRFENEKLDEEKEGEDDGSWNEELGLRSPEEGNKVTESLSSFPSPAPQPPTKSTAPRTLLNRRLPLAYSPPATRSKGKESSHPVLGGRISKSPTKSRLSGSLSLPSPSVSDLAYLPRKSSGGPFITRKKVHKPRRKMPWDERRYHPYRHCTPKRKSFHVRLSPVATNGAAEQTADEPKVESGEESDESATIIVEGEEGSKLALSVDEKSSGDAEYVDVQEQESASDESSKLVAPINRSTARKRCWDEAFGDGDDIDEGSRYKSDDKHDTGGYGSDDDSDSSSSSSSSSASASSDSDSDSHSPAPIRRLASPRRIKRRRIARPLDDLHLIKARDLVWLDPSSSSSSSSSKSDTPSCRPNGAEKPEPVSP